MSVVTYVPILTSIRVCLEDMIEVGEAYLLKRACIAGSRHCLEIVARLVLCFNVFLSCAAI